MTSYIKPARWSCQPSVRSVSYVPGPICQGCPRSVPRDGGTPSPPAFDSKIFLRKDFDSNRDMELVRTGISVVRTSPKASEFVGFRAVSANPGEYPTPPPRSCGEVPWFDGDSDGLLP